MAKSFSVKKQETVFGLQDTLTFGKCRGATLEVVIEDDCRYIRWCLDNIPWFKLDKDAETLLLVWEARDDTYCDPYDTPYDFGYDGDALF